MISSCVGFVKAPSESLLGIRAGMHRLMEHELMPGLEWKIKEVAMTVLITGGTGFIGAEVVLPGKPDPEICSSSSVYLYSIAL